MMSILGRIFPDRSGKPVPTDGDLAYAAVMGESDDLLKLMRDRSNSSDAARAVMADIWAQNRNVPFLTTVIEAVQEAKSPLEQNPEDR